MIIGLTGGIGSGKSAIARGLYQMGYTIYDTDSQAKRIMEQDPNVISRIKALLGEDCYDADNHYLSSIVADKVFSQPDLLTRLNAIVHPAVQADIEQRHEALNQSRPMPLIVESAILLESGLYRICDKVIAVTAPEEIRIERAMQRDHSTLCKIHARMRAQATDEQRAQIAHIIVNNDGQQSIIDICQYINQHL